MSSLHDALEAMDKATSGPWEMGENVRGFYHIWGKKHEWVGQIHALPEKSHNDAILIAAAPDMAAWIKEALPWLEEMRLHVSIDPAHYDHELARLDALIARAKPEEVGR